ncbi:MAG: hypothetical protein OEV68_01670 [candidate division Zixibacteria bacterium]|nr:hypothetical protein [candidate division Zixibacteria bacterium]
MPQIARMLRLNLLTLTILISLWSTGHTATDAISYQGRLTMADGNPVSNGQYSIQFAIYDDSLAGQQLWSETATIVTLNGLFTHLLGTINPLPDELFKNPDRLYLQVVFEEESIEPRSILTGAPTAGVASDLIVTDHNDTLVIETDALQRRLSLFDQKGQEQVKLQGSGAGGQVVLNNQDGTTGISLHGGLNGDESVVLPDSSVSSSEIIDETGYVTWINVNPVTMVTLEMTDLINLEIETPADGYIVLEGKCYVELSGTTGPNVALVQIDASEGGGSQFPYYTLAGLGGYVNTNESYFPVYVTRVYWRQAGVHYFRMEGRANNAAPALARSWDHILTAVFYPTSYGVVSKVSTTPDGHPNATPHDIKDPQDPDGRSRFYQMDMRYFERRSKDTTDRSNK